MAKATRKAWIFSTLAVVVALGVGIALLIRLLDDGESGPSIERTTPWTRFATLEDVGTLSYSCGFPGRLIATRLSITGRGAAVTAGVGIDGRSYRVRIQPGGVFLTPYGPSTSHNWDIIRKVRRGRITISVPAKFPPARSASSSCPKPDFTIITLRPKEPGE